MAGKSFMRVFYKTAPLITGPSTYTYIASVKAEILRDAFYMMLTPNEGKDIAIESSLKVEGMGVRSIAVGDIFSLGSAFFLCTSNDPTTPKFSILQDDEYGILLTKFKDAISRTDAQLGSDSKIESEPQPEASPVDMPAGWSVLLNF